LALDKDAPLSRTANRQGIFFADQSSADCITNMSGFDFWQATAIATISHRDTLEVRLAA
jgi:hypothetical protein